MKFSQNKTGLPKTFVTFFILLFSLASLAACGGDEGGNGGSDNDGSGITDTQSGITLRVRPIPTESNTVQVTWSVSNATLSTGANDFELQLFVGGGQQWQAQVSTDEPTENGSPVGLKGVPESFCFRMIATVGGRGAILGSGLSGNKAPCI